MGGKETLCSVSWVQLSVRPFACNCLCVCTCVRGYSVYVCVLREGNKSDLWQKLMNYWTASSKQTFLNAFAILSLTHDGTFSHQRCSKPEHTNGNITKITTLFVLHWCCYILFSLHTKRERNEEKGRWTLSEITPSSLLALLLLRVFCIYES